MTETESSGVFALPASFGQERFWDLDRLQPGNPTWNLPVRFRLHGALDTTLVERAFNEIVRRHEALRTTVAIVEGEPAQVIAPSLNIQVPVTDLRHLPKPEKDAEADRLSLEEAHKRFDLTAGPLFRVGLLRVEDEDYVLMVTPHHSMADYWSVGLISNELGALYEAYARGLDSPLPPLPIQYGDYAIWQHEQAGSAAVQKELTYWKEQLKDLPLIEFPTDRPRPAFPTYNSTITSILLPTALTDAIREIANRESATFFNAMLAAFSIVLNRYTGQTDFGVATQAAGRSSVEVEPLIGLFINTVVLRQDLSGDPAFPQLLSRVNEVGLQSIANQNVRFEQLLKELRPASYPSHHELFRVNFICQRDPVKPLEFSGIQLTVIPSKSQGALYDLNVFLVLRNEGWRLACEYNTDLFDPGTITKLLENYRTLLESLAEDPDKRISEFPQLDVPPPIPAEAAQGGQYAFPITVLQRRFWLLDQLVPGNPALNMQAALRLNGSLDLGVLTRSLNELIRRHEMLRTSFDFWDGQPIQIIHPALQMSVGTVDLQDLPEPEREAKAQELLREEARQPFALSQLPLVRATLLQLAAGHRILTITMPHIICDGWSDGILIRELTAVYDAFSQGRPSPLAELSIQYADFAHWQSEWLENNAFEEDLAYWKRQLQGRLPLLDLPAGRPVQAGLVSRGETETLTLPNELVGALKNLCKREEITLFMLFLAIFKTMLHRYTGQEDILAGSPVAGRAPETEGVVGLFSYPISLRTDLSGDPTFRELLARVRDVTLGALAHKDLPFSALVEELKVEQIQGRNPLFQVYFLHQVAFLQAVETPGLSWTPLTWVSPGTAFDLHLATLERREGVVARLEYNPDMFDAAIIQRMLGHFRSIAAAVVSNPGLRLSELPLLTPAELELVSPLPESPAIDCPSGRCVHELFEEQARRAPNAIAIVSAREKLTYAGLDRRATRLSNRLREMGIGPETLVGICGGFSPGIVIAALAALKAGGAYLWPFSGNATDDLIRSIKVVATEKRLAAPFLAKGARVLYLDEGGQDAAGADTAPLETKTTLENLACGRFTSGSTGDPKIALIAHKALLARVWSSAHGHGLVSGDRIAISSSNGSMETIFSSLIRGAAAVLVPGEAPQSQFLRFAAKQRCTVLVLSTRRWQQLVFRCEERKEPLPDAVRLVSLHGDRPTLSALSAFSRITAGRVRWISVYGTAETGMNAFRDSGSPASLGAAAAGFAIRLLDGHLQPVPIGVSAEICVQGAGLARGYLDGAALTQERFAVAPATGARWFRTGDFGRYLEDGSIEFLGSRGRHLNLNGFRLHVGEMEAALLSHPAANEVVAVSPENHSGDPRPIVYVAVDPEAAGPASLQRDTSLRRQFRAALKEKCPGYPQPQGIVLLDRLVLNANGDPNRRALPPADPAAFELESSPAPPREAVESQLVKIWEEILGVQPIGIHDNFFDLNGHSLLALRLFTRINSVWKKNLPLSTLFEAPTIERLAEILRQNRWSPPSSSLVAIQPGGSRLPLYIISGVGGNVVRFRDLARHLGPDQPVYALQPPGMDGSRPYLTRLEDMAAHYIREIKANQPAGPYHIAGYSFGGLVTFEMGRQLMAQEGSAGLIVLLDAPEWHYMGQTVKAMSVSEKLQRVQSRVQRIVFGPDRLDYLKERIRRRGAKVLYSVYKALGRPLRQSFGTLEDINMFAAGNYVPGVYPGQLTLLRTSAHSRLALHDYQLGWGALAAGGVEVHGIPGDHDDMTSEPNVRILAQKLKLCLDNAGTGERDSSGHASTRVHPARGDPNSPALPRIALRLAGSGN